MLVDRYIFFEWLKGFLLCSGVIVGILFLSVLYDDLSDLIGFGASTREIIHYFLLLGPSFLPAILPLTLLISILFTFSNLNRNLEITALRAAGYSLFRISRPVWLAGGLIAGTLFWLNADLVPRSMESSTHFWENLRERARAQAGEAVTVEHSLGFHETEAGRMWFLTRFNPRTRKAEGFSLIEIDERGRDLRRIQAQHGQFDPAQGAWNLRSGREIIYDPEKGEPTRILTFTEQVIEAGRASPEVMVAMRKRAKDLSLFETVRILRTLPKDHPEAAPYQVRYHSLIASPLTAIVVVGLAIPFAVGGTRSNAFVGISKSGGLFFFFFLLGSFATLLGERGFLNPALAAWLPIGVGTAIGLFFLFRER